jgi:Zn-dependent protease
VLLLYASILAHEYGHSLVARDLYGVRVHHITLFIFGGVAALEDEPPKPSAEFWITIAGPLVSLLLGIAFLAAGYWRAPQLWETFNYGIEPTSAPPPSALVFWVLGLSNVALAVFNMIPGFPLDGGRVFRAMLWALTGNLLRATRWVAAVSRVMAFALAGYGVGAMFEGAGLHGLWLVFLAMFLLGATRQSLLSVEIREGLRHLTARQIMELPRASLASSLSLDAAAAQFLAADQQVLPVVDSNEDFVGLVSVGDLGLVPRSNWGATTLRGLLMEQPAALRGLLAHLHVTPNAPGLEIYARIAAHPLGRLPVLEGGRLVGIIPRQRLLDVMRRRGA